MYRNLSPASLHVTGRQSEIIELSLSYGFKGIDIDLTDFQQSVKANGLAHAKRYLDSAKLKFGTFKLPLVWDEDDDTYKAGLSAMRERVSLAAQLGLNRAIVAVSPANDLRPYHENFEFHRRRLTELGDQLTEHGVKLGVEFRASAELRRDRAFQFIHTFDALVTLVGMIRRPNVGAVVDLFEIYAGGGSIDEVRKLEGGKIVSVIASDMPADKSPTDCDENDRLMPAETGVIDLSAALVVLAELGYDGPVTPAISSEHSTGMKREQIVKIAGERLKQAWDAAGLNLAGKLTPVGAKK
ncbi:MAG: sugar phosphate isomerase/epimerase [Pirellulales bacterium]|nr:sugar phosphate isomerase/epimerase [Pirellulales bacterium]